MSCLTKEIDDGVACHAVEFRRGWSEGCVRVVNDCD